MSDKKFRAGFVGLIGLPNSGKSTLMNRLVGEKVSIVTAKPQTTRRRVMGLVNTPNMQAVFVDAPGIIHAHSGLNLYLRDEAMDVITNSDVLVAVLNIDEPQIEKLDQIIQLAKESGKPWVALIHKTDLPQIHRPQILRDRLAPLGVPVISGSSIDPKDEIREKILEAIEPLLPEAERPLFDTDLYTLSTVRELSAEIIREKCFENLHQEVPFGLAVKINHFIEDRGPVVHIDAEIIVAKENHRPIVIGREGALIKKIGSEARKEIEALLDRKVFLELKVTSRKNWMKNLGVLKDLGYVINPS